MKRNKAVKLWSVLMAAVMTAGLTACGNDAGASQPASDSVESSSAEEEQKETSSTELSSEETPEEKTWTDDNTQEVTIMMLGDNTPDEDNIVIQALEEKTDTQINIIYVPTSDYNTKLNSMVAAETLPDIFWCGDMVAAEDYRKAGYLANVEEVLNAVAPNVVEETKDIIRDIPVNKDGIYLIPNMNKGYGSNICIRTDWLKNLNLEMPTDLESFAAVMHAFTYDDPDGNGQDDTFGYSFSLENMRGNGKNGQGLFGAFGIAKGRPMEMEDGTVTTWVKHPEFLNAMKYVKSLIDDGVCEPDYVSIPQINMFEKLWNGTSGCMEWECVGPTNNWMPGRYVEDPAPEFGFATLKGPDGKFGNVAVYNNTSVGWCFSAESKNLEGAARIADYCMSEEGSDLLTLGVEGVMYNWIDKEAGTIEYLGEYTDTATHRAAGGYCYYTLFRPFSNAEFRTLNAQTREGTTEAWSQGIDWVNLREVSQVYTDYGADMDQIINEMFAELLTTDEDKMQEVYDNYIQEWENAGGSDWEAEVTQLWKEQKQGQ